MGLTERIAQEKRIERIKRHAKNVLIEVRPYQGAAFFAGVLVRVEVTLREEAAYMEEEGLRVPELTARRVIASEGWLTSISSTKEAAIEWAIQVAEAFLGIENDQPQKR